MPDSRQRMKILMHFPITKRLPCAVCGLSTFRHTGWFLVVENRWLDRIKILSWHPSLATQRKIKSVCCRDHLKTLIIHWVTQASLRLPPVYNPPMPIGSNAGPTDFELVPQDTGRLIGELAVHRDSFSRVWSGSPESLECILDKLNTVEAEKEPQALEVRLFNSLFPSHELSLQPGAGRI